MKIAIDSDATGLELKHALVRFLNSHGEDVTDLDSRPDDEYPDIGYRLAKCVARKEFERGILICGTGLGMAMIANKVKGIYAGTPHNIGSARRMAASNNAQIITIGAEVTTFTLAKRMIVAWLETPFRPRPNARRLRILEAKR